MVLPYNESNFTLYEKWKLILEGLNQLYLNLSAVVEELKHPLQFYDFIYIKYVGYILCIHTAYIIKVH